MKNKRLLRSLIVVVSAVAAFLIINACLSYSDYNLYTGGKWQSSKTQLKKGVVGAWSMMLTKPGLKEGALNLNAWNGHQELILKQTVTTQKIEFSFQPLQVPFSLIIDKTDSLSTGIFFYPQGRQKMIFYTSDHSGRFRSQIDIPLVTEVSDGLTEIYFSKDSVEIILDHVPQAKVPFALPSSIRPGFRGSSAGKDIYIDNIRITSAENKIVFSENFSSPFGIYKWSWVYLLLWLPLILYCMNREKLSSFMVFSPCAMTLVIAVWGYYHCRSSDHYVDDPSKINWHGIRSTIETQPQVEKRLEEEYPIGQVAGKKKVVLFVGSSQTWGAGSSDTKATFASIVQDSLRCFFNDTNIVVINTGISSITSDDMYKLYTQKWYAYNPVLTVVNASNNDTDTLAFRKNMQAFASFDRDHGIKSLWIEEPNDGVKKPNVKHLIMRSVASANDIACIEMQSHIDSRYDSGYLWWDWVHLTDYGHQVFADRIFPIIVQKLEEDTSAFPSKH
ncbi:MAG: hypothetical protein JWO03_2555 [Bacteroidetes bacterium]|nr:hypothetical protein [Bacteroidota bacterium]